MTETANLTRIPFALNVSCPLYNNAGGSCQLPSAPVPLKRLLCQTDEHDACPLYLSYLLRRTHMLRRDHDWLDAS